ncbi:MAG: PAS domain-containing protein, partial [Caulobacteraceae bacterium]
MGADGPDSRADDGATRAVLWFFENSLDVFAGVRNGFVRTIAGRLHRLTGWEKAEVEGRPLLSLVHPEDAERLRAALAGLAHAGAEAVEEHRLASRSGNWLWVRSHWARGDAGWIIGIIRDIHFQHEREQRSAEARQVAALLRDTAGVTIWRHDPRTGEFEFNPDFAAVTEGERREGAILGDGVLTRIHAKDAAAVEAAFSSSQASGEPAQVDYREWTSRGGWRNIRSAWRGSRRLEEGGFELVGISEDVT